MKKFELLSLRIRLILPVLIVLLSVTILSIIILISETHPSKINFFEKVGVGNTPVRGNFTIATKTNSYGKIIPFCTNNKHYAPAII